VSRVESSGYKQYHLFIYLLHT